MPANEPNAFLDQVAGAASGLQSIAEDIWRSGGDAATQALGTVRGSVEKVNQVLGLDLPLPSAFSTPPATSKSIGFYEQLQRWVLRNKALTAAIVSFAATGFVGMAILSSREMSKRKPRRAKRTRSGARKEVMIIVGKPGSAMVRSLASDMERRGFIVFVVVRTVEDMNTIQSESRTDIKPLLLDIDNETQTDVELERLNRLLSTRQQTFSGDTYSLDLSGVVLVADTAWTTGRAERRTISMREELSLKLLTPIDTLNVLLPLAIENQARIAVITPHIVHSLSPPLHMAESTAIGALQSYARTLMRELPRQGVHVCQIKAGSFDYGSLAPKSQKPSVGQSIGSPPGELHRAVFDALTMRRPIRSWHVGAGSLLYDRIGSWTPFELVNFIIRRQQSY